jgi:Retrotransposon gag protein
MYQTFLAKYFPPRKISEIRSQIMNFRQRDGESLYESWEKFKELLRICLHHGLEEWIIVQTFYDSTRMSIDAPADGAFANHSVDDAFDLIENIVLNQSQWSSKRQLINPTLSKYEVSDFFMLHEKIDALTRQLGPTKVSAVQTATSCEICGAGNHVISECQYVKELEQEQTQEQEQVNMLNNSFRPQNNPYSNTYNPDCRNHPNFSYKNNQGGPSGQ